MRDKARKEKLGNAMRVAREKIRAAQRIELADLRKDMEDPSQETFDTKVLDHLSDAMQSIWRAVEAARARDDA